MGGQDAPEPVGRGQGKVTGRQVFDAFGRPTQRERVKVRAEEEERRWTTSTKAWGATCGWTCPKTKRNPSPFWASKGRLSPLPGQRERETRVNPLFTYLS